MIEKLWLCASLVVGFHSAASAQATMQPEKLVQTVTPAEKYQPLRHAEPMAQVGKPSKPQSALTLRSNEMWWGYFNGKYKTHVPKNLLKYGFGGVMHYAAGIKLPLSNDYDIGTGKTIEGIKFVISDLKHIEDVKIWISTKLSAKADMSDCDICVQDVDKADLVQALNSTPDNFVNEIRFDHPYTIADKEVYVGYSFRVTQVDDVYDECPLVLDHNPDNILGYEGAFLRRFDTDPDWMDDTVDEVLAMQVLFSSDALKQNAVNIDKEFYDVAMKRNDTVKLPLTLSTIGQQGLESFRYVVSIDGQVTDEQTVVLDSAVHEVGGRYRYEFPLTSGDKQGVYNATVKITEVNGAANEGFYEVAAGNAIVVENAPTRKVFVEDYTLTWGRGAPWGFVNKEKLRELYGDQVLIAYVHNGSEDPMATKDYEFYTYKMGIRSFPNTDIDRTLRGVYPYLGTNQGEYFRYAYADDIDQMLAQLPVANVDVDAKLSDDETQVNVETKVRFEFSGEKDNYALFYLLTEDGMQDETWVQRNGMGLYADMGVEEEEPLLDKYINGPEEMTGLVYDDVVIAAKGVMSGVAGSVSPTIQFGEAQTDKTSFRLSDYPIVQDKQQLNVIAVLLDTQSGKVVNACKGKVATDKTAIRTQPATAKVVEVARYTVDGRRVQAPVKGLNIVHYSDGSVVKCILR